MAKRTDNFNKFIKQPKGSAIKEQIKQEKKKQKKERAEAIEAHFARKREERLLKQQTEAATRTPKEKSGTAGKPTPKKANPSRPLPAAMEKAAPAAPVYQYVNKKGATEAPEKMLLNKYVAHAGISSRRDAAELVKSGKVTVNGKVETNPATKVSEADVVKVSGKSIKPSHNLVYILLNKPKDYITTVEDPEGRKTVLDLVRAATTERVYPVGRLDRNTSGVLLLTNDGDLAQKLSHPKHEVKKIYEVKLDRVLSKGDMEKIAAGITLDDGFVAPDAIAYADSKDKSIIGIEIHSGRNRIVRRIFEHLKYDVKALDRVMYAGLTKKDVLRGKWRFLKEKEVRLLKYMNQSFVKAKK